jgi:tRNA(fMet)-specific endonuclease VapC
MRRYLLDTGIVGDLINERLGVDLRFDEVRRAGNRIVTCMPVVGELFGGVEGSRTRDRNRQRLVLTLNRIPIWPFDRAAAEEFGRLDAELRRIGRSMQQIDIQIAAIALSMGNTTVVSRDSDLSAVPGLTVENWAAP